VPDAIRLGLVGGICSGKSTAAAFLGERGWEIVDADKTAHEVYASGTETVEEIRAAFGPQVVLADGSVDRKALGAVVFGNPEALRKLEALVHPATRVLIARRMGEAVARTGRVALEMTLLHRWPEMAARLDQVVGVRCPDEIRLARLMARNDLTREQARARFASQACQEQILSPATAIVENDGTVEDLRRRLAEIPATLVQRPETADDLV
jgi:dephospho-CoA kinase